VRNYIILQIALKKGYFVLIIVKPIKYSKEKSAGLFKIILGVFK